MNQHLTLELILRPEVQQLLDSFAALMRVRALFLAADGAPLGPERRQGGNCDYCRLVQGRPGGQERCLELDRRMRRESLRSHGIERYFCHAGLGEMIAPVFAGSQICGYIMIGQFRAGRPLPPEYAGDSEMARAWEGLPDFTPGQVDDLQEMFRMLVDYVVARELVGWRGDRRRELVEYYLDTHLAGEIRLGQLARYVGCSVSGLTHWFREHFGSTFKQLLTEKRLERAEYLLRQRPEMSIGEIAAAVGYEDSHYFSRIFRRCRGVAPTALR